jgi:hypothetical protein
LLVDVSKKPPGKASASSTGRVSFTMMRDAGGAVPERFPMPLAEANKHGPIINVLPPIIK